MSSFATQVSTSVYLTGYLLTRRRNLAFAIITIIVAGTSAAVGATLFMPQATNHTYSDAFPTVTTLLPDGGKISAKGQLLFTNESSSKAYDYRINLGQKQSPCTTSSSHITCELAPLQLAQSQAYSLTLQRHYQGKPAGTAAIQKLTSIEPMVVINSSIPADTLFYDIPSGITLTLSKPIQTTRDFKLEQVNGTTRTSLAFKTEVSGSELRIIFSSPLPRTANIELTAGDIEGTDHSFLTVPYVLPLKTSGGPTVKGVSITNYKASRTAGTTITFDVALKADQSITDLATIVVNDQSVPVITNIKGRTLIITPAASLPLCTPFTIKIASGLLNEFGVGGGPAWQHTSRTICQTIFSIGTSVQGRDLTAYKFVTGSSVIVYVGNMHGNEKSSSIILNQWVETLEANPSKIPANRTIVVIPTLSPDGNTASSRTNANNVDLNRNFPANDWKSSVIMPDKSSNSSGGGSAPLSEPESAALATYILSISPRLVLTYHSTAGVVIPNSSGDSETLARLYDKNSNLYYAANERTTAIFAYDTTGAFEDWLHDKYDIPALLVETWTMSGNEYAKNVNAMWAMATL